MTSDGASQGRRSPRWTRIIVVGLCLLLWASVLTVILRGEPWRDMVFWAAIGTLCLSGVDLGLRRRVRDTH